MSLGKSTTAKKQSKQYRNEIFENSTRQVKEIPNRNKTYQEQLKIIPIKETAQQR